LSARWLELVEIAVADPDTASQGPVPLLAMGSLDLGQGQALAWCEMARGLLLHWVQLDQQGAVQDYRVLAPTDWNFHPDGALAQALAALAPGDTAAARTLAAAFDPCVAFTV
jgi:Ni,Fe-hydrogenase I large subunit